MSEFKFACPVCGQHITADSGNTGSQLECPTCYRKIIVPQAPASPDSKFILSAAEANKPRPPQAATPAHRPFATAPGPIGLLLALALMAMVLCAAGGVLYAFRGKIFGSPKSSSPANASVDSAGEDGVTGEAKIVSVPVVTNDVAWALDLADTKIPDSGVAGKLRGEFVSCRRSPAAHWASARPRAARRI